MNKRTLKNGGAPAQVSTPGAGYSNVSLIWGALGSKCFEGLHIEVVEMFQYHVLIFHYIVDDVLF